MSKFYKEPFFHFILLGVAIFVLYSLIGDCDSETAQIVINDTDIAYIGDRFYNINGRMATDEELGQEVENYIRQEVSYREAMKMNLDEKDQIVKQRLAQKMDFLLDDMTGFSDNASGEALKAFYDAHPDKYLKPARYSFYQIGFTVAQSVDPDKAAKELLKEHNQPTAESLKGKGDQMSFPFYYENKTQAEIKDALGGNFGEELDSLTEGKWAGPVKSAYASHLVYISNIEKPEMATFPAVKERVERDYLEMNRQTKQDEIYQDLRSKYVVRFELDSVKPEVAKLLVDSNSEKN